GGNFRQATRQLAFRTPELSCIVYFAAGVLVALLCPCERKTPDARGGSHGISHYSRSSRRRGRTRWLAGSGRRRTALLYFANAFASLSPSATLCRRAGNSSCASAYLCPTAVPESSFRS